MQDLATNSPVYDPWTTACQVPLSIGFPRQECLSRLPFPGDLPDPGTEPWSLALQADSLPAEPTGRSQAIGFSNYSVVWFGVSAEHWPHFRPVESKHRTISNTSTGTRLLDTVLTVPWFPATSLLFSSRKSMPRLPILSLLPVFGFSHLKPLSMLSGCTCLITWPP